MMTKYNVMSRSDAGFMTGVFGWMFAGLIVTGATAFGVSAQPALLKTIYSTGPLIALIVLELILVMVIGAAIKSIGKFGGACLFLLYSFLNGLTLSAIFAIYTLPSLALTFFVTAGTFGAMAIYGWVTKRDLSSLGSFFLMALLGLIFASIANIFLQSSGLDWIITCVGILVFVGLTAYDIQRIKELAVGGADDSMAILGALSLYLDFVNLFLYLLKLFGKKKN